ncbi:hypothetical protein C8R45DRAFT_1076801 [Mycena sanguinolenta]|nr:hypothetical protein C8R45DRAFT_1076801 [Mycena sanguinolenta]
MNSLETTSTVQAFYSVLATSATKPPATTTGATDATRYYQAQKELLPELLVSDSAGCTQPSILWFPDAYEASVVSLGGKGLRKYRISFKSHTLREALTKGFGGTGAQKRSGAALRGCIYEKSSYVTPALAPLRKGQFVRADRQNKDGWIGEDAGVEGVRLRFQVGAWG